MRKIVIDSEASLESVAKRLSARGEVRAGALEQLVRLNPHVDARRITPGTVLLIPDGEDFSAAEGTGVSAESFGQLQQELTEGLEATAQRLLAAHDALATETKEVTPLLKSAAMNRAMESDPALKALVEDAAAVYKNDEQQAKEAREFASSMREEATAELGRLVKLVG